jgi:hypothetical protein
MRKIIESENVKVDEEGNQKVRTQVNVQTNDPSCKDEKEEGGGENEEKKQNAKIQRHHLDFSKRIIRKISFLAINM